MGQERLGPSHFFIPLVLGPLNSLVWYVPSLRYTLGLGWRMHCDVEVTESSTNKQHHIYMSSTIPLPPLEQLCNMYCSNKHTHTPVRLGRCQCHGDSESDLNNYPGRPESDSGLRLGVGFRSFSNSRASAGGHRDGLGVVQVHWHQRLGREPRRAL